MRYITMDDERACRGMVERFTAHGEGGVSTTEAALLTAIRHGDEEIRRRLKLGFPALVGAWEEQLRK